jgi:hypothetical protein
MSTIPSQGPFPPCLLLRPGRQGRSGSSPTSKKKALATGHRLSTACRCGHPHAAHEHYRPGSECGQCGCGKWRRARPEIRTFTFTPIPAEPKIVIAGDSASDDGRTAAA